MSNEDQVTDLRALYETYAAWPKGKHPRNGAPSEEWEPWHASNRARDELLSRLPELFDRLAQPASDREALLRQDLHRVQINTAIYRQEAKDRADGANRRYEAEKQRADAAVEANRRLIAMLETPAALTPSNRSDAVNAETALREALAAHDKAASVCPFVSGNPPKNSELCEVCGADSGEPCRKRVIADAVFVDDARAALSNTGTTNGGGK